MYDYKEEIIATRKGHVGSSDARMLAQIAYLGYVPKTAYRRMAIIKGLIANTSDITTAAMRFGDFIENAVFEHLVATDMRYESNPMWTSEKYSRKNVACMTHPDIVLEDKENKSLYVYEVKAVKGGVEETRQTYKMQLYHHTLLAKERAQVLGYTSVKVFLCHYNTDGIDLDAPFTFDPDRLTVREVRFNSVAFDLNKAMNIVDDFLETFDEYYEDENIDAQLLPEQVHARFLTAANLLREIKRREEQVNQFKDYVYQYLTEKGIKKISCDEFSFTVVQPSESASVDYAQIFADEIESKHPIRARRLKQQYTKTRKRKGYVTIKVNDDKDKSTTNNNN